MKQILLIILLCCLSFTTYAAAQQGSCKLAQQYERKYNQTLPIIIDDVTTFINYIVNCQTKSIKHEKQVFIDPKKLTTKHLTKVFYDFVVRQCSRGFSKYGWTVKEYYYNKDMRLLFTFEATAKNCK